MVLPGFTKQQLERVKHTPQIQQLINYLYQTRGLQAEYIVERSKRALQRFVNTTPAHLKQRVGQNINALASTRGGWYPLIDYVNFKGEGLNRTGGYRGQKLGHVTSVGTYASQPTWTTGFKLLC